jgi:DNA-binding transcriptional regulator YiaG
MVMAKKKPSLNPWPAKLKALRKRLGNITQAEAAERFGCPARTWIAWENDQRTPGRSAQRLLVLTFPELA